MTKENPASNTSASLSRRNNPKPKRIQAGPIEAAIKQWLDILPKGLLDAKAPIIARTLSAAPTRWVVYPPMVLLPSGSFAPDWWDDLELGAIQQELRDALWELLLDRIGKKEGKGVLTHLAINAPIPLQNSLAEHRRGATDNVRRTPGGLITLYGDFGPALLPDKQPSAEDFEEAFWVSTKQNGIVQVWAPRYTMFSRGNVKEKARILDFYNKHQGIGARKLGKEESARSTAIDMYAGIGYFVFSYVKMGMGRVVGWELNPWSVEGLRRGAVANGWSVRAVRGHEAVALGDEQITLFEEDNSLAAARLERLESRRLSVRHVNCGLLPTSLASWKMALGLVKESGWLHLHENVGIEDVGTRRVAIEGILKGWMKDTDRREVKIEGVEFVKTFAPGIWHIVFDIYIAGHG